MLDRETLQVQVKRLEIGTIYLLAAMLSANGEQYPQKAWQLNMQSLLNVLEVAREENIRQLFWPSSIAVFGPDAPKKNSPLDAALRPTTVYGIIKLAGEQWCEYYHERYGLDVRSLRYPGNVPESEIAYAPDGRQVIAGSWPGSLEDEMARKNWEWNARFGLKEMVREMVENGV